MTSQIKTTRFWLAWSFASLLVYPLVAVFLLAFSMFWFPTMEAIFPSLDGISSAGPTTDMIFTMLTLTAGGGIVAFTVGVLQVNTIKRYFHFRLPNWIRATVAGGLIGAPVTAFVVISLSNHMSGNYWQLVESGQFYLWDTLLNILPMTLYVTIMSAVQLIVLRQYVRSAWLWILANAIAGLMFSMVAMVTFRPGMIDWLLAAIAQGAITGFAMLWLLHRLTNDSDDDNDGDGRRFAYQRVPIDKDDRE